MATAPRLDYATACAFRFLRQPSRPNAPTQRAEVGGRCRGIFDTGAELKGKRDRVGCICKGEGRVNCRARTIYISGGRHSGYLHLNVVQIAYNRRKRF